MNEEIKEILWIIKSCKQDYDKQKNGMHTFDYGELYLLYDYITNLQQENKRLKETNVYCNRTDCVGRIKDSRKYNNIYQEKEDYKSKVDNALKIIEKEKELMRYAKYDSCLLLIENALKNGSKENNTNNIDDIYKAFGLKD